MFIKEGYILDYLIFWQVGSRHRWGKRKKKNSTEGEKRKKRRENSTEEKKKKEKTGTEGEKKKR